MLYNLIVWQSLIDLEGGPIEVSHARFLEYTSSTIREQLGSLSREAIACIASWPTILMTEGRGDEEAHIVRLGFLKPTRSDIVVPVLEHSRQPFLNADLWKIRDRLDIEQFEFSRSHWAIKDIDLFRTLAAANHHVDPSLAARFHPRPLPAPDRPSLINARNIIGEWGHTDVDDFVLEAGVEGLEAGREIGSRRDRANAIVQFALKNPTVLTAEGYLFSAFLVRAASSTDDSVPVNDVLTDPPAGELPEINRAKEPVDRVTDKVFIVHGRNEEARSKLSEFLEKIGLQGIVLHEQPNMGRHLLTKFIDEAELVTFAVVLMTDDDVGGLSPEAVAPRARQNVILELGYFLAHLGQRRVCALITPGLETPSDFDGIVYIKMDDTIRWQKELRRELEAADMPVQPDANC